MLYYQRASQDEPLRSEDLDGGLRAALEALGDRKKVLIVPPDITRLPSEAGALTRHALRYYGRRVTDILPALGTHHPMTAEERHRMFGSIPDSLFRVHDWRHGVTTLGEVPSDYVRQVSGGALQCPWPAQVNRRLVERAYDLILSIGQVVPHEVSGMANDNKNILVGVGGAEAIHISHFLSAVYGLEKIMGRPDTPVRRVLDYASDHFIRTLPIVYVLTVVAAEDHGESVRGLFIGDDRECFERAAALSLKVNLTLKRGFNTVNGEDVFFISNPGLGLWSTKERFR
ncbi:MAG: DUF2088 domain-containing protein [Verrucomicrobia bacterium]|nr:DUF2088 domain-containing protein [Verrucomicrobiota bacterium]